MRLEYLKPGHCPICFALIPHPAIVNITLNNGTYMPQPVCDAHFGEMLEEETQKEILNLCKLIWVEEINLNTQYTKEEQEGEISKVNKLEVKYNG